MGKYYLSIDIGASSGRHMIGSMVNGTLELKEIYRFENKITKKNGNLLWDIHHLFEEIKNGLKKCKEMDMIPTTMGIDTWAVDYVLLDEEDQILGPTYAYRDHRTNGMDEEVYKIIGEEDLYARTGIQKQIFNTVYQLMAVKKQEPQNMNQAKTLLLLPDYFHFLLTGVKMSEYTNATSTQLVEPNTFDWDHELIRQLGYNDSMFLPLHMPGTTVGSFIKEIEEEVGFNATVVLPATHDTASAVVAIPSKEKRCLYISSGTWSLMGVENKEPILTEESRKLNFTNEGGYDHRFRFLKNIMGLWMIQSVRREINNQYTFAQLCDMAEQEQDFPSRVDVNHDCFLAPESMIESIKNYCIDTNQPVPETIGQISAVIYESLVESYVNTTEEIERLTNHKYEVIHIVGGGSNAEYLNQRLASRAKRKVIAGPSEATAIGNIVAQMLETGELTDLEDARGCIRNSFSIRSYDI